MKDYLFVYGLFRDSAKPLLGEYYSCGRASVHGDIYKVNEFYPGFKIGGKSIVWGEVILIDKEILPKLDEFEGEEYERQKVKTSTDLTCWVYVYKGDCSNFKKIKAGDWLLR